MFVQISLNYDNVRKREENKRYGEINKRRRTWSTMLLGLLPWMKMRKHQLGFRKYLFK